MHSATVSPTAPATGTKIPARRQRTITLTAIGSRGDVQPMLALALALRARGHLVRMAVPPNFVPWITGTGIEASALGIDIQAWLNAHAHYLSGNPITMLRAMRRFFSEQLPHQFLALKDIAQGSDLLVLAGLAFAGFSVAETLSIPALAVAYTPCVLPGAAYPPPMVPWQSFPAWLNRLLWAASNRSGNWLFGDALNQGRATLGLPPVLAAEHLYRNPWLLAADPVIFPPSNEWLGRIRCTGFICFDDTRPLDPDLDAWLAAGDPPLYVGLGSMTGAAATRLDGVVREALADSGRRVLLSAGWGGLGHGSMPPGWRVVGDVPHARLFPRCSVVVHHGGSGTLANVLRAGVPQVILPLILDQFHHADRLSRAGLAPSPLPLERVRPAQLAQAIVLAERLSPSVRTAAADRINRNDGARQIAEYIES